MYVISCEHMQEGEDWYYHTTVDPNIIISFINTAMPLYTAGIWPAFYSASLHVAYAWIFLHIHSPMDITIVFHITKECMDELASV